MATAIKIFLSKLGQKLICRLSIQYFSSDELALVSVLVSVNYVYMVLIDSLLIENVYFRIYHFSYWWNPIRLYWPIASKINQSSPVRTGFQSISLAKIADPLRLRFRFVVFFDHWLLQLLEDKIFFTKRPPWTSAMSLYRTKDISVVHICTYPIGFGYWY